MVGVILDLMVEYWYSLMVKQQGATHIGAKSNVGHFLAAVLEVPLVGCVHKLLAEEEIEHCIVNAIVNATAVTEVSQHVDGLTSHKLLVVF